jgi:hypothetical protein
VSAATRALGFLFACRGARARRFLHAVAEEPDMFSRSLYAGFVALLFFTLVPAAVLRADDGFLETFADDPLLAGRWQMMNGEDASRLTYDAAGHVLLAHYDTGLPTARLVRPLGRTLTQDDTFRARATLTIKSAGFFADPYGFAQIAFGFLNSADTGVDRAGGGPSSYAFDTVTFDYFPNLSTWANQTLCTTVICRPPSAEPIQQNYFDSISFPWGAESDLGGEQDLPRDVPLDAEIVYDGFTNRATLRVLQGGAPLLLNDTGGRDHDRGTITTVAVGREFSVDRLGLLLWNDTFGYGFTTVRADVVYGQVEVNTYVTADFDGDGDVDGEDFAMFAACRSGPAVPVALGCDRYDADGDDDVDQDDFGAFQLRLTGAK